jgi:hypothetical protein
MVNAGTADITITEEPKALPHTRHEPQSQMKVLDTASTETPG